MKRENRDLGVSRACAAGTHSEHPARTPMPVGSRGLTLASCGRLGRPAASSTAYGVATARPPPGRHEEGPGPWSHPRGGPFAHFWADLDTRRCRYSITWCYASTDSPSDEVS